MSSVSHIKVIIFPDTFLWTVRIWRYLSETDDFFAWLLSNVDTSASKPPVD